MLPWHWRTAGDRHRYAINLVIDDLMSDGNRQRLGTHIAVMLKKDNGVAVGEPSTGSVDAFKGGIATDLVPSLGGPQKWERSRV